MSVFNNNKNSFNSSIQMLKSSLHAYQVLGVPKDAKNSKQLKRNLISNITNTIENVDTNDFGIRVIIIKTLE